MATGQPTPSTPLLPTDVTLAILAGGAGSRMGKPKADLQVDGKPILRYLLDRFAWPGPTLLVTAPGREHPPANDAFTREVHDPIAGEGPMRGVLTALDASPGPVLITTVDMPGITSDQLRWLLAQINAKPAAPGILCRPNGRVEPFPSVYRKSAADVVRARLESRRFFVHGLLDHVGFAAVVTPTQWPDRTWANLNRPEDVAAFGRM